MSVNELTPVLMVDDEPNVLDGYRRSLHGRFRVVTAKSGAEGLAAVERAVKAGKPFPVIVSDMKMPAMNGAEFLGKARAIDSDAVQMLLSGQADLESTIAAVNNGNLFRFLSKPCSGDDMEAALTDAARHHQLVRAERELLESTLAGAVDVLTEVLASASPEAFARTRRVHDLVTSAAKSLKLSDWRLPLAAMLSQVGAVAVPPDVLQRALTGKALAPEEIEVYRRHPEVGRRMLEKIPRLEDIARWIGDQPVRPPASTETGMPSDDLDWDRPAPEGAEPAEVLLHAALVQVILVDAGVPVREVSVLLAESGRHPKNVLDALARASSSLAPQGVRREITVDFVAPGMVLLEDVVTRTGIALMRKGERITEATAMRLDNFARTVGICEPVVVQDRA
ncbi:HD domain-containing phosphohydrolase [Kineosporia sp. NBRC 101731]|uniref:HD domain-containing phosphohydrolase n=1 Tax=Kineosporia sp. NBRC 101731 TaxID=3032199 RepID=UPI0024A42B0B|nr:HD domain-containing phosphohydrolase [Kineosporia sp. NBRC 101731]GLY29070.1 response regulator receiver modulated metal-depenent phosphohydrolase [Kineosporia sp. NBRC 101731]